MGKDDHMMQWAMMAMGVFLLLAGFVSTLLRRMYAPLGVFWMILGLVLGLAGWQLEGGLDGLWVLYLLLSVVIVGLFVAGVLLSSLLEKTRELAMQVSLLNQENEQLLKILDKNRE